MARSVRQMSARAKGLLVVLTLVASACSSTTRSGVSSATSTGSVPAITAPESSTTGQPASDYCAMFIDFANWSLANLGAVTAEAGEPTFTVRDAFFTEYLVRMSAMQKVEPTELDDALATFANYAQLYLAHDISALVAQTKAMTPAAALINGYGKTVCGYDPQVTTSG